MGNKLITLEQSLSFIDSINIIGFGYIELAANGNNPPTVKQDTKFGLITSTGLTRYILETGDRAFSWGIGSFPIISDGTWYIYCYEEQSLGNNLPGLGNYGASKNVPSYDQTKGGWYNSDGKVIGTFTVASSIVSGITVINNIQVNDSGVLDILSGGIIQNSGPIINSDTSQTTSKDTGAIITEGGIGVEGNIHAGGTIKNDNTTDSTSKDTGAIITEGGLGVEKNIHAGGTIKNNDITESTSKDTGAIITEGGLGVEKNVNAGGYIHSIDGFGPAERLNSSFPTQDAIFGSLNPVIPNNDDKCLLSGFAIITSTGNNFVPAYAVRNNSTRITIYGFDIVTGSHSVFVQCNDGNVTTVFDGIICSVLKIDS